MNTIIKNGTLYDGSGSAPYRADLLVQDDKILDIAPNLNPDNARMIEASGLIVTPGFIDPHRHCDVAPLQDPRFGQLELAQGISTTLCGNCGIAPVPTTPRWQRDLYDYIEPVVGPIGKDHSFYDYLDWTNALQQESLPINIGFLVGAGAVKTAVNGFAKGDLSAQQLQRATAYVREGMQAGAHGLSLGLMYQPECWSTPTELIAMARAASSYGGVMSTHIRGEGDSLVSSVQEVIDVAAQAEIPLKISHFKATGIRNWRNLIFKAIERIENARARGQQVSVDFYPYAGGSTTLQSLLPPSVMEDDMHSMLGKMGTAQGKQLLRQEIYKQHPGWDNMAESIGWDRIVVSAVTLHEHAGYAGKNLASLADQLGYSEPADLVADLLYLEQGKVGVILMSMAPSDVDAIARLPYSSLISDGLYTQTANPHPRLYGSFPKFLRNYAINRSILPLETAIHKMTGMPAQHMGIQNRGLLKPGNFADICLFNPAQFKDRATFTDAARLAQGMHLVMVNGKIAWKNESIQQPGGKLILHQC